MPTELRGSVVAPVSALMCVDYAEAPCGPYRELLFIPGAIRFADGRRHASISRILVSTWDSVVNGRRNWGIPKDRADFDVSQTAEGHDRFAVRSDGGQPLCELEFESPHGVRLPLRTSWIPPRVSTLAQRFDGRTYYYRPVAKGSLRLCRLRHWWFDAALFPDLSDARVLAAFRVERFEMTFPTSRVES